DVLPNSPYTVTYTISNNNQNIEFQDITTQIQGLVEKNITTPLLRPGETKIIYRERLQSPNIEENKAYEINSTTRYRVSGQLNTIEDKQTLNILGSTSPILITQKPS